MVLNYLMRAQFIGGYSMQHFKISFILFFSFLNIANNLYGSSTPHSNSIEDTILSLCPFIQNYLILSDEQCSLIKQAYQTQSINKANSITEALYKKNSLLFITALKEKEYENALDMINFEKLFSTYFEDEYINSIKNLADTDKIAQAFNSTTNKLEDPWQLVKALNLNIILEKNEFTKNILDYLDVNQACDAINIKENLYDIDKLLESFKFENIINKDVSDYFKEIKKYIKLELLKKFFTNNSEESTLSEEKIENIIRWKKLNKFTETQRLKIKDDIFDIINYATATLKTELEPFIKLIIADQLEKHIIDKSSVALLTAGLGSTSLVALNSWCYSCTQDVCQSCLTKVMPVGLPALLIASLIGSSTWLAYKYLKNKVALGKPSATSLTKKIVDYGTNRYLNFNNN